MVAVAGAETALVVIQKFGDDVAPAATVTVAGTLAAGSELVSATTAPPGGAGLLSFTLLYAPITPAVAWVGLMVSDDRRMGTTVNWFDADPDGSEAVTVTVWP